MRRAWLVAGCAAVLFLAGCAPVAVRPPANAAAMQQARAGKLLPQTHWTLEGHLAVSDGQHGGSGTLTWQQDGQHFVFTVRAPITGQTVKLAGGPDGAVLEGLKGGPVRGADAEHLMQRVMGWHVPFAPLVDWVRGLEAQSVAAGTLQYGADGLPVSLDQAGWKITYKRWFDQLDPALPKVVFAADGPWHVRLAIRSWRLGAAAPSASD